MVRAAGGVVSEERFSGSKITPCTEQIIWSYYNVLLDLGIDIDAADANEFTDAMLYELSQHMSLEDMVKKFHNLTLDQLRNRIWKYTEELMARNALKGVKHG